MYDATVNLSILQEMVTQEGKTLKEYTDQQPILLVFLRHFGCVFCKEALADLAEQRKAIEQKGTQIIFVHLSTNDIAEGYFQQFGLEGVNHVSDPDSNYYSAFGITKGSFSQLYGLSTWMRGYAARKQGYKLEVAKVLGDSTQMPGIFLIHRDEVKQRYIHRYASERPDYMKLLDCCSASSQIFYWSEVNIQVSYLYDWMAFWRISARERRGTSL